MDLSSVVLLQSDSRITQSLVSSLRDSFRSVHTVPSLEELRSTVAKHRAAVVILDMEMVPIKEIQHLCREFPSASVVCNHRLADEEMWTKVLAAGASDICPSSDTQSILTAARRGATIMRSAAA